MLSRMTALSTAPTGLLVFALVAVAVISYFLGCCNGAILVSKLMLKDDVRNHGSGNAGLTNFARTNGGNLSFLVIAIDALKTVLAVLVGMIVFSKLSPDLAVVGKLWGGLFVSLGHGFPCIFQFRGGKGVLSGGVIAIMVDWRIAVLVWGAFIILAVSTKYVSLGSIAAGALFPVGTYFVYHDWLLVILGAITGFMLVAKHHANIGRLLHGTESKFKLKKKDPENAK